MACLYQITPTMRVAHWQQLCKLWLGELFEVLLWLQMSWRQSGRTIGPIGLSSEVNCRHGTIHHLHYIHIQTVCCKFEVTNPYYSDDIITLDKALLEQKGGGGKVTYTYILIFSLQLKFLNYVWECFALHICGIFLMLFSISSLG